MVPKSDRPRRRAIYGITRVDDDHRRMHCWIVHIERKQHAWKQNFSDGAFGGKLRALQAARAFRDEVLASQLPMTRGEYAAIRRRNNRSGVPGVHRRGDEPCWIAFWTRPDGSQAIRKFSIKKYGEKAAFERAKAARLEALSAMDDLRASPALKRWLQRHHAVSAE